jgi:hypothetical protein
MYRPRIVSLLISIGCLVASLVFAPQWGKFCNLLRDDHQMQVRVRNELRGLQRFESGPFLLPLDRFRLGSVRTLRVAS